MMVDRGVIKASDSPEVSMENTQIVLVNRRQKCVGSKTFICTELVYSPFHQLWHLHRITHPGYIYFNNRRNFHWYTYNKTVWGNGQKATRRRLSLNPGQGLWMRGSLRDRREDVGHNLIWSWRTDVYLGTFNRLTAPPEPPGNHL